MKRTTRQKKLIDSCLSSFDSFFTAEELLEKVHQANNKLGLATIYRFLKSKVDAGELHSYQCDRRTIYSLDKKSHCHFHCEECGNSAHITLRNIDFLKKGLKGKICHFQINVVGICEKCCGKN